eukprot:m.145583 g.145583  ORF g.145583 m.145583 type:complete len:817 (+) comp38428_c0_seq1:446-2896(+)
MLICARAFYCVDFSSKERCATNSHSKMDLRHVSTLFLIVICRCGAAPVFTKQPSSPTAYYAPNGSLDLVCETRDPSAITWHEEGSDTPISSGQFNITTTSDRSSRLHSDNAGALPGNVLGQKRFCRATDTGGETIDSSLFIIALGVAPTFNVRPVDSVEREEGNDTTLECSFTAGTPAPDISWTFTRKGSSVAVKVGGESNGALFNNLLISNPDRNDTGKYTCKIENEFDSLMATSVVTVTYPPDVSIHFNPSPKVKRGDSVNVTCRSVSNPLAANHSLLRNGSPIPESTPLKAPSSSVGEVVEWRYTLIASNETEGIYQCEANNSVGIGKSKNKTLDVLLPPDKPKIKVSNMSNVCWTTGFLGNPPITNYSLSCTTKTKSACGDKQLVTVTTTVAILSNTLSNDILCANLSDTSPSTGYTCSVNAFNGAYDVSSTNTDVSLDRGKPGPVTLDPVSNVNNTEFTLTWCVSFTGGISITQTAVGLPGAVIFNPEFKTDKWTATVTQLAPDTTFNVKVKVTNSEGEAESNEVPVKTKCVPDVVLVTNLKTNSEENTITFTESRTGTCNTDNEYILKNEDTVWASTTTRNGDNVTITFDRVIDTGAYSLTITAQNGNQESVPSAAIQFEKEAPIVGPTPTAKPTPTSSGGGGLSTGALVGIIIAVILIILIIVLVVIICLYKQKQSEKEVTSSKRQDSELGTDGKFKKEPESAPVPSYGYDHKDKSDHPGPNSGSTYSPAKTAPKKGESMYADLDHGDKEQTPVPSPPKAEERVEYAQIDREASQRRREEKKREMEMEDAPKSGSPEGQPTETELSTMV